MKNNCWMAKWPPKSSFHGCNNFQNNSRVQNCSFFQNCLHKWCMPCAAVAEEEGMRRNIKMAVLPQRGGSILSRCDTQTHNNKRVIIGLNLFQIPLQPPTNFQHEITAACASKMLATLINKRKLQNYKVTVHRMAMACRRRKHTKLAKSKLWNLHFLCNAIQKHARESASNV